MKTHSLISLALLSLVLTACGGGSGGSGETKTNPVVTNTQTSTQTATETVTSTQTETETETDTDSDTATETETELKIEHLSGGETSTPDNTADAFSERSFNMTDVQRIAQFELGDDFFQNPWVAGSASTSSRDGLGGLFNNNACQDCHIRDGRGHAPSGLMTDGDEDFASILFRAARSNISEDEKVQMLNSLLANVEDSSVGAQLQQEAIAQVMPEVELGIEYETKTVTFADGYQVELRDPIWHLTSTRAAQGYDFDADTVFSARVAPPMIGLGLLALISEQTILANQDINDTDNDGISGKANYVWSVKDQAIALGRFGWKASQPSLIEQSAAAFVNDMGLTNKFHQQESCLAHQTDCINAPNGNGDSVNDYDYEVSDIILDAVGFYSAHLSVPQRKNAYDDDVQRGKALFMQAGCQHCHTPSYVTEYSDEHPELSEQTIFPYTDLLLHDMGEDLADFTQDNQPASSDMLYEFLATATEWRTPPLWGIGRAKTVDPEASFLHDGRARTIMEAVLWHGGEAQAAKQAVLQFNAEQRSDFNAFLNDL
ncbi:c-type cytochrome [Catenovulum sp. SM1970]|uniref:di-heme oxidoreductase family protein n=1 Tax=Marinifaba aquimaris TaxID=2741323 RepID=UPI001572D27E|nr:di-heme oxidoredictase family protein [Marinifaba aquimaris]NTS78016.1 c-type cytochrome [Marinifaba aquimaris]